MNDGMFTCSSDERWIIRQPAFDKKTIRQYESLFSLANGHLGIRGDSEFRDYVYHPGTYINGFYDLSGIVYGESAYGFPPYSQTIVNLPNSKQVWLFVNGREIVPGMLHEVERLLDLKRGVVRTSFKVEDADIPPLKIECLRVVPYEYDSVVMFVYKICSHEAPLKFSVVSGIDDTVTNIRESNDPRIGAASETGFLTRVGSEVNRNAVVLHYKTALSGKKLALAFSHGILSQLNAGEVSGRGDSGGEGSFSSFLVDELGVRQHYTVNNLLGEVTLVKYVVFRETQHEDPAITGMHCRDTLNAIRARNVNDIFRRQQQRLATFWQQANIEIDGDEKLDRTIRMNLFHIFQAAGRDGVTNIPAKGLSGEGYQGHYFWDSEIYALPFMIYSQPAIARKLLEFRHSILPQARERAVEMAQKGALFPWRTINGREASAYFPAGTAQYHINADIAYTCDKYLRLTGDIAFLYECALEIMIETSRFWIDIGTFIPRKGNQFCINEVTGPDEYSALVNNNFYTNIMARYNLLSACRWLEFARTDDPVRYENLTSRLRLAPEEVRAWQQAADHMYLPFDVEMGIHPQDDSFLNRQRWDFEHVPADQYPLLLHFHPLVIYRFQVIKQADVVLALFLQNDRFTHDQKQADFDYYEKLTTGDSSLSACIQGIMAAELGYHELCLHYFKETAFIDIDDVHGNTCDGIHVAGMAGTWLFIVYGFAGLRDEGDQLRFSPWLPAKWHKIGFSLLYRGRKLDIVIGRGFVTYRLSAGTELSFFHRAQRVQLSAAAATITLEETERF